MDLNGLSRYCFIILKDTMGCLFWKNYSTASYGRESSLCANQTPICDIRSYHVRLVLFLSPSFTSSPNFSLTCLTQVKIKITKDSCHLRHVLSQETQFDPMEHCVTIARACNKHWRKHHLKPDCIAVEPPDGWHKVRNN